MATPRGRAETHDRRDRTIRDAQDLSAPVAVGGTELPPGVIDRINVSFAGLTMRDDLGMSAAAFGFALGTFYWGYSIFELPSNLIME